SGNVRAPIAFLYDGNGVIAQIDRAQFTHAAVQNVALRSASATVGVRPGGVRVYAAVADIARQAHALATGAIGSRNDVAISVADFDVASLGALSGPVRSGQASLAATMNGYTSSPRLHGAMLLNDANVRGMPVNATSAFTYGNGALALAGAAFAVGPAFGTLDGSVNGLNVGALHPRFDLTADVRGADVHGIAAILSPRAAQQLQGTVNARVALRGDARAPSFDGTVAAPEGSVHGLAFRDMSAHISGSPANVVLRNGRVVFGSTAVAFRGEGGRGGFAASADAPRADLADFNDFFDTGDTLGGRGSFRAGVSDLNGAVSSNGAVALDDARYRRIELGRTVARWHGVGNGIAGNADIRGSGGSLAVNGSMHLRASRNIAAALRSTSVNGTAHIRNFDLRTWLPLAGIQAPVTGLVNADATANGAFPDVTLQTRAALEHGTIARVEVQRLMLAVDMARGRGVVRDLTLQIPNLQARGSGTFGLHPRDSLAVDMHVESPNAAAVANEITGRTMDASGALTMNAQLRGSTANPHLRNSFAFTSVRYKNVDVPRFTGVIDADRSSIGLSEGDLAFDRGSIAMNARTAVRAGALVNATFSLRDVEASNFTSLFAEGTKLGGQLDGDVAVGGTKHQPQLNGALTFSNGSFSGPDERAPITHANARIAFEGRSATLQDTSANVGGGNVTARGNAALPDLADFGSGTFHVALDAQRARVDMPKYMQGELDANVWAARQPHSAVAIGGNVAVPTARLPLSLFYNPNAPQGPAAPPPPIAFDLHVNVGNDVRVQSPNVDVGARGALAVTGTLAQPQLSGQLESTGGTVSFFRTFRVQSGTLAFDPSNGVMPMVDAVATTTVQNPMTNIALRVTGLAPSHLNVEFNSDPPYDRAQILGLLVNAQAIGAVPGIQTASTTGGFSPTGELQNLAMGQINTLFTRNLLEPLNARIGSALGLENFGVAGDFRGGFGLNATKVFGKNLTATFSENLGSPRRQAVTIRAQGKNSRSVDLVLYTADNPNGASFFSSNPFANLNAFGNTTIPAVTGTQGFRLMYGRQF
ncbi:MAG: translocation/assembly module TamB domain-containing protein, partial [Candidatus Eremiobacteraeota bacterium]|nr:translocation/assembly module TamB domain-containing protein [Candidatus Eremiobacteraeota bacterium]